MSMIYPEKPWDYLVKQTYGGNWKARTLYGSTLAESAANTSLEDLINACVADKGSTPGIIKVNTAGADFNIDGPIQLSDHTLLEFVWPWNTAEVMLEAGSDCHMVTPTATTNIDMGIRNGRFNGNKANNAGAIDGISMEMTNPAGGNWKTLRLEHVDVRDCDRDNIRLSTDTGSAAGGEFYDIRSYGADENCYYFDRVFDSKFTNMDGENFYAIKGFASNVISGLYISGGFPFGILLDDMGTTSFGPHKNTWNGVRVDNTLPNAGAQDGAIVLADTYWNIFNGPIIANLNTAATDEQDVAIRFLDGSKGNVINGGLFCRDPEYTAKYWKTGVKEEDTANGNLVTGVNFVDAISTQADDAEIELLAAGSSIARNCIRDGGLIARTRRL